MLVIGMMLSFVHRFDSLAAVCINNAQRIINLLNIVVCQLHVAKQMNHSFVHRTTK